MAASPASKSALGGALTGSFPRSNPRRDMALAGRRVRLVSTTDEWTDLRPGAEGVIEFTDHPHGTTTVRWDSGSRLSLLAGIDKWELLP